MNATSGVRWRAYMEMRKNSMDTQNIMVLFQAAVVFYGKKTQI